MADPFIDTLWSSFPDCIREEDTKLGTPMKTWLSGVADQADEVEDLLERMYFDTVDDGGEVGETSDLGDPSTANEEWLPWLAQLFGVSLEGLTPPQQRELLMSSTNFIPGSETALRALVGTELTGGKSVRFHSHSVSVATIGSGTAWDWLIVTKPEETPVGADLIALIMDAGMKPAGVVLHHETSSAGW